MSEIKVKATEYFQNHLNFLIEFYDGKVQLFTIG